MVINSQEKIDSLSAQDIIDAPEGRIEFLEEERKKEIARGER